MRPRDPKGIAPELGRLAAASTDARHTISVPTVAADRPTEVDVAAHTLGEDLDPRLILLADPTSPRAAAFRLLAHRLRADPSSRVVAVSSPRRGEGKTTLAVNLALALRESPGARVLLVETGVDAPALADLFGFRPPLCFAEQLAMHRREPLLSWSAVDVRPVGLHVAAMRGGDDRARPTGLDAVSFLIAIERLRAAGYDWIVIDASPVLSGIAANLVQDAADGALLCASARATRARDLRRAVEQLSPGRILGVALLE